MNDINIEINEAYKQALTYRGRYLNIYGGAGSGKSIFAGQKLILRSLLEKAHKFLLVRKVHKTIKGSQYELIKRYIYKYELNKHFEFKEGYIKCISNGNEFITAGLDDVEKLKSIEGVTGIWIEEATELSREEFNQVDLRLRGNLLNYKQIILTYNPIDHLHWLNAIKLKDCLTIQTTFKDNKFIDKEYISTLEQLQEQNPEYYKIYALGQWGVKLDLIYKPFVSLVNYPESFDETIYGLDFGYNNPTALIEVNIKDKCFYLKEKLYETKLTNTDLINKLNDLITNKNAYIYCDCAEPQRIEELRRAGFNAVPSDKSVKAGIDYCKAQTIYSNYENENLNEEINTYCWRKDKNGNLIDEPVKYNDHLLDAMRYAIYTHNNIEKEVHIYAV